MADSLRKTLGLPVKDNARTTPVAPGRRPIRNTLPKLKTRTSASATVRHLFSRPHQRKSREARRRVPQSYRKRQIVSRVRFPNR